MSTGIDRMQGITGKLREVVEGEKVAGEVLRLAAEYEKELIRLICELEVAKATKVEGRQTCLIISLPMEKRSHPSLQSSFWQPGLMQPSYSGFPSLSSGSGKKGGSKRVESPLVVGNGLGRVESGGGHNLSPLLFSDG